MESSQNKRQPAPLAHQDFSAKSSPLEKVLLATLLDTPSMLGEVSEILRPDDFFNPIARKIYDWLVGEAVSGHSVSPALAQSRFADSPKVEAYLFELLCELPSVGGLLRIAEELRELASRRQIITEVQRSLHNLTSFDVPYESGVSELSRAVSLASDRSSSIKDEIRSYAQVGSEWLTKFEDRTLNEGGMPGITTGFAEIDEATAGLQPADLIIIGARPSMGKTTFTMNIMEHIAINLNEPLLVFSMEMPRDAIFQRSVASVGGVEHDALRRGKLKKGDAEKVKEAYKKLTSAPLYIDDDAALTLNQVVNKATKLSKKVKLKAILLDYLQLMTLSSHFIGDRNNGIGEISRGLKKLAKDLDVPVIALSQLSRDLEKRANKRPVNSDLRDSGSIEQDADVIGFLYRDEVYNPDSPDKGIAEFIIGKQRNGPLATIKLGFDGAHSRFNSLDPDVGRVLNLESVKDQCEPIMGEDVQEDKFPF